MTARRDRYTTVAIVLHWVIAAAILAQVSLAGRMEGPRTPLSFAVTQLHKSIGITILLLSLLRLAWRLMNPPPPLPATMARWEKVLSQVVHAGLYGIMIGMPLTGWLMVSASKITLPTLLYGTVPWPNLPVSHLAAPAKHLWHAIGENGHNWLAKVLYVLVGLHVAGALKHQLFSRDEPVLAHMAPGAKAGRWLEPRLFLILLGVVVVGGGMKLITPPSPGMKPPPTPAPATEPLEAEAPPAASPASGPAPAAVAATAPAAATAPVRWNVTPGSTVGFATTWGGQAVEGRFDRWTADIMFSPQALDQSKIRVRFDLSSVNTGDAQRDASLAGEDWFDSAAHPKATFTATRFEARGGERYVAHGVLELRGVKKPVDLPFRLHIAGDKAQVSGVTNLDRTAFGVGQGEWTSTDQIPAKVSVSVTLKAKRG
jgi:cytochrome b561/polyisoprenoid-binding protein YceI